MTKNVPALRFPEFSAAPPWETKTLGEVCEIINGGTPSTSDDSYWGGDIPWITPAEMGKTIDPYVSITRRTITESGLKKSGKLFPPNSVILSVRAPIGHLAINNVPMATNQGCSGFIPSGYINYKFLFYFLFMSKSALNLAGAGSTFTEISVKSLRSFLIPLPSLPEQEKIAACLSSLDEVMIGQSAKLDSLRDYKKGLLQQLFPVEGEAVPRLRFPDFETAAPWETKNLGEICEVLNNRRLPITSTNRTTGSIPYYGASGIIDYVSGYIFDERILLVGEDGAKWGAYENTSFIVEGKSWVNNHAHVLKPIDCIDVLVSNILNMLDLTPYITGVAPPKLTLGNLLSVPLTFPSRPEQEKIAGCLSSLEDQIIAASDQLATLKSHKKGLMQQLFPDLEGFQGSP